MIWEPKEDDPAREAGCKFEYEMDDMRMRMAFWQGVRWQRDQERIHRTFPSVAFEPEDRT